METTDSRLQEIIKVRVKGPIILHLRSLTDYKIWKAVYPDASIISYDIQTV